MKRYVLGLLLPAMLAVAAIVVIAGLRNQQPESPTKSQRKAIDVNRFPIAEFSAPEPVDPVERFKRRARNQKYDRSDWGINPEAISDSNVRFDYVDPNLPAFPFKQSKAVMIGRIIDARAYLSNDKTGIYSVFGVQVDEVLQNASQVSLTNGTSIEVEREGGRIKFPSGRIHLYMTSGQDMPRIGSRYVLFLADGNNGPVFQIVTGYELAEGRVYPLDRLLKTQRYENADETSFLTELRLKITDP